mgnify:CR=1 FL=1
MSSKVDLKIYLEGYKNVSKKAQELGVEDLDKRKEELENQIKKAEETVNEMTGMTSKEFQAKSKKYIELIKSNEKELAEIDKKQEERAKNPKIEQEIKDLGQAKNNIIESAKEAANKALNELEDNKPNIKALNEKKKEQQNIEQQLKDMKQEEKTNPKKVKDTKYKEYLAQKLKTVKKEIKERIRMWQAEPLVVVETALMFESGCDAYCDEVWGIFTDPEIRIDRLLKSRGYSREKSLSIMQKQMSYEELKQKCSHVLFNDEDPDKLWEQIKELLPI